MTGQPARNILVGGNGRAAAQNQGGRANRICQGRTAMLLRHRLVPTLCAVGVAFAFATSAVAQQGRQITIEPATPAAPATPAPAEAAPPTPAEPAAQPPAAPAPVAACDPANFINTKKIVEFIAGDLDKLPAARAKITRYVTLTQFANLCADESVLNAYRQAVIKLLNSLSRSADVVRLEAIDPRQSIIRVNIADLGWTAADWDSVLATYPYGALPDSTLTGVLERVTGTKLPFVRGDWLAFATTRPPLYGKLHAQPKTIKALASALGVDIDANIKNFLAQRAGFLKSGLSVNNRVIERHPSRSGYYWVTYDFAGSREKKNVFEFPLGPGGEQGFVHDASLVIYSLPNGFQAYYQSNGKGDFIDKGPAQVYRDPNSADAVVTPGISCMGCHGSGLRPIADEVRAGALKTGQLARASRERIEGLYASAEKLERFFAEDSARLASALARAGLDPNLKLADLEIVTSLSKFYEQNLDLALAAAELGLTADEFGKVAKDADRKLRPFIRRLQEGPVSRDQFEASFAGLVDSLTEDEAVKIAAPKAEPPPKAQVAPKPVAPPRPAPPPRPYGGPPSYYGGPSYDGGYR
jgi:hypothetical protein